MVGQGRSPRAPRSPYLSVDGGATTGPGLVEVPDMGRTGGAETVRRSNDATVAPTTGTAKGDSRGLGGHHHDGRRWSGLRSIRDFVHDEVANLVRTSGGTSLDREDGRRLIGLAVEDERRRLFGHQHAHGQNAKAQRVGPRYPTVWVILRPGKTFPVEVGCQMVLGEPRPRVALMDETS